MRANTSVRRWPSDQGAAVAMAAKRMENFDSLMRSFGFRPPTREDMVAGATLYMIDVERYMQPHNQGVRPTAMLVCSTQITLDETPVRPSFADQTKEVVFYHCTVPAWDGQCFVPLEDVCASGHRAGLYENDTRWVVKA